MNRRGLVFLLPWLAAAAGFLSVAQVASAAELIQGGEFTSSSDLDYWLYDPCAVVTAGYVTYGSGGTCYALQDITPGELGTIVFDFNAWPSSRVYLDWCNPTCAPVSGEWPWLVGGSGWQNRVRGYTVPSATGKYRIQLQLASTSQRYDWIRADFVSSATPTPEPTATPIPPPSSAFGLTCVVEETQQTVDASLVRNGSFESQSGGLPTYWFGPGFIASNFVANVGSWSQRWSYASHGPSSSFYTNMGIEKATDGLQVGISVLPPLSADTVTISAQVGGGDSAVWQVSGPSVGLWEILTDELNFSGGYTPLTISVSGPSGAEAYIDAVYAYPVFDGELVCSGFVDATPTPTPTPIVVPTLIVPTLGPMPTAGAAFPTPVNPYVVVPIATQCYTADPNSIEIAGVGVSDVISATIPGFQFCLAPTLIDLDETHPLNDFIPFATIIPVMFMAAIGILFLQWIRSR